MERTNGSDGLLVGVPVGSAARSSGAMGGGGNETSTSVG